VAFSFYGVIILAQPFVPKLLVIDNYDSFTYNLIQMFMQYHLDIEVRRNDEISLDQISILKPDYILISPGPKDPAHAGISTMLIKSYCNQIPLLGVCLGMQCINEAFNGKTIRSPVPVHGKTSYIRHTHQHIFNGLPDPFRAARYHSLMVDTMGNDLVETAHSDDGVIMGLSHPEYPVHGVQFHPESFMTQGGFTIIENFLRLGPMSAWLEIRENRLEPAITLYNADLSKQGHVHGKQAYGNQDQGPCQPI